jgi:hypothetical protein
MMKNYIKAAFAIFLFYFFAGCANKTYPTGTFQEVPVTVDGNLAEWNTPLRFGSSGGQVQYNVTNDNDNIYISLETHDGPTVLKILREGVNIYIDPAAGKNKNMCLAFPLANTTASFPGKKVNAAETKPDINDFRQALLIQTVSFKATGFKNMDDRVYDVSDKSRIKVALKSESNNSLGYEAVIPMQFVFGNVPDHDELSHNLSVGIIINAMKMEGEKYRSTANSSGAGAGMHAGGHGGGSGRGMGGGGNYHKSSGNENSAASQMPDRSAIYKQDTNWYTFKLADKK